MSDDFTTIQIKLRLRTNYDLLWQLGSLTNGDSFPSDRQLSRVMGALYGVNKTSWLKVFQGLSTPLEKVEYIRDFLRYASELPKSITLARPARLDHIFDLDTGESSEYTTADDLHLFGDDD